MKGPTNWQKLMLTGPESERSYKSTVTVDATSKYLSRHHLQHWSPLMGRNTWSVPFKNHCNAELGDY